MTRLSILTCVFCGVLGIGDAIAAELTLEQCIQRAVERNSGIKSFEMSKEAAEHNKLLNRSSFFPRLKMKARYALTDQPGRLIVQKDDFGPGFPDQDVNLADEHRDSYQAGFNLLQPLYTGGSLSHTSTRAEYQLSGAESDLKYQRNLLEQNVKQLFFAALAADMQNRSSTKSLAALDDLRRITKDLLAEGFATRENLLAAEADYADAEAKLVSVQNQSDLVRTKLRRLMNASPEEAIEPVGELAKLRIDTPLSEFLSNAGKDRHDIQAMFYQTRQSDEDVDIARSGLHPNISLQGEYLRQRETNIAEPDVWTVMVSAEWNVFDWGKTAADVERTSALSRRDAIHLEELKKDAIVEIEGLWRQARTELSRLLSIEARIKSAELVLEQSLARRREGRLRQVDVLKSEASLWQEYGAYYQSAALLHGVIASLERATALPVDTFITRSPLYRIDFSDISERVTSLADIEPTQSAPDNISPADVVKVPTAERQLTQGGSPACRLQFGAFSQKDNAERLLKSLNSQDASQLKLSIVAEERLYKVMSDFFTSRDEALQAVRKLGIKTYIVRI
ncbi:MAG: outer membrane efflux protein [uncultured bacterium]|nr:MAG: outer membrane efflux protein [uncultured bacterium]